VYLIDTDILVFALRGHPRVAENIGACLDVPAAMSVISYGELLYGAARSRYAREDIEKVREFARGFRIVDVTPSVMETFASLRAALERAGRRIDDMDLIIAATAVIQGAVLVSNNEDHFRRVPGLSVENWTK